MTSSSASEPNSRTTPTSRDPLVGRGPLAVVRPPASAVDEFGSEAADVPLTVKSDADAERERRSLPPLAPTAPTLSSGARSLWTAVDLRWVSAAVVALLVAVLGWTLGVPAWRARSVARLTIETVPSGADVIVAGSLRGATPLELELPPGKSEITVRAAGNQRVLSVDLKAGEIVRQSLELSPVATAVSAATVGTLEVTSEPTRVALVVDGAPVGLTPLTATTLSAGDHVLSARFPSGVVERRVRVDPGRTTTLHLVSPTPTGDSIVGWLNVDTAVPLRIFEEGRLLGTTDVNRVMLPVGTHALHFVSDETGFEADRTVTVSAGRPTAIRIDVPTATLSINARPWAEVFVDGERIGDTPIGNLTRPIGRHEIVLRHPELGERRQTVMMTLRGPTRVSVDFQSRAQ